MGDIQFILTLLEHSPYIILSGAILWYGRKKVTAWDAHIRECNQIPKVSIMEKLNLIHIAMDKQFEAVADRIAEVKTGLANEIERVDNRYHDFLVKDKKSKENT